MTYFLLVLVLYLVVNFHLRVREVEKKLEALDERHEVLKSRFDDTNLDI